MSQVLAYFLTWSCYGTWLHGDARGSVDRWHNAPGTPRLGIDIAREERSILAMKGDPYNLSTEGRNIVEATIRDHCRIRGWFLHAVNARTTHVHVVANCCQKVSPDTAMDQFKAWCTRKLREAGHAEPDQEVWTSRGSKRRITDEESLARVVHYVLHGQ